MELEEMKTLWNSMSEDINKQKILTDKLIIQMTQQQYNNKLRKISIPELAGTFVCFAAVLYIAINFYKLETWLQISCGILSILFLVLAPIISLKFISKIKKINIEKNNYKQTLIDYSKSKKHFLSFQKISFYLSFALMLIVLPVFSRIMGNKDFFTEVKNSPELIIFILFTFVLLFFYAKRVLKYYSKNMNEAENILKDLEV